LLAVGETMAMVAPVDGGRLLDAQTFIVEAGGAESNVAAHVAALGHRTSWFGALGADALGDRILARLNERGVDVSAVIRSTEHPTGLYVKDPGNGVSYYRRDSAAAWLTPDDAEGLELAGLRILHVSGITPALSASAAALLDRLIDRADAAGVTVSFDVNHRPSLWQEGAAAPTLDALVRRAGLVLVGRDEAEALWGTATAHEVRSRFPEVPELIVKDGAVGATVFAGEATASAPSNPVDVVDVVGAGDAFAGGYLAALLDGAPLDARLRAGHDRAALTIRTTSDWI
jgi:2-dehydro-3-deoxygluconokinase